MPIVYNGVEIPDTELAPLLDGLDRNTVLNVDDVTATAAEISAVANAGANGTVPTANSGDTGGIGYAYPTTGVPAVFSAAGCTAKALTMDPTRSTSGLTMVDGTVYFQAIYLAYDATLTGVAFSQAVQGDTTADNNNKVGLYTKSGTTLTLVASSADDGTLWESALVPVSKEFTSTYAAQAGLYYVAALANWSAVATAPQIGRQSSTGTQTTTFLMPANVFTMGTLASQTDLPESQDLSGVTAGGNTILFGLY